MYTGYLSSSILDFDAKAMKSVYQSHEFMLYVNSGRDNSDGTHKEIVEACTSNRKNISSVMDAALGIDSLEDFITAGGKFLPPVSN